MFLQNLEGPKCILCYLDIKIIKYKCIIQSRQIKESMSKVWKPGMIRHILCGHTYMKSSEQESVQGPEVDSWFEREGENEKEEIKNINYVEWWQSRGDHLSS